MSNVQKITKHCVYYQPLVCLVHFWVLVWLRIKDNIWFGVGVRVLDLLVYWHTLDHIFLLDCSVCLFGFKCRISSIFSDTHSLPPLCFSLKELSNIQGVSSTILACLLM